MPVSSSGESRRLDGAYSEESYDSGEEADAFSEEDDGSRGTEPVRTPPLSYMC